MIPYLNISSETLRSDMSWFEKILISLLGVYTSGSSGVSTASDKYMANEFGVSYAYVNRTITSLKERGMIVVDKSLGRRAISLTEYGKKFIYTFQK